MKNNIFQKNQLLQNDNQLIRVLDSTIDRVFIINCVKRTMPVWVDAESLKEYVSCTEDTLYEATEMLTVNLDELDPISRKITYERFTMIAPMLTT